jgi:hypothetical protein
MSEFAEKLYEMDTKELFDMREWFREVIEAKGAKITDQGIGISEADIGFELHGAPFLLTIQPRKIKNL